MEIGTAVLLPIATIAFTRQTQDYVHRIREEIIEHYYASSEDEKTSKMQNQLTANLKLLTTNFATPWVSILSRSEEHTSELQSRFDIVCRLLLEKKKISNS